MKTSDKVKVVKTFNKHIKSIVALAMKIDNNHDVLRLKTRISAALEINETIFLDRIGPLLLKYKAYLANNDSTVDEFMNDYSAIADLEGINEVDSKERSLFLELFKKLKDRSTEVEKSETRNIAREMLEIYEFYKAVM
jgi:hypothetical protein